LLLAAGIVKLVSWQLDNQERRRWRVQITKAISSGDLGRAGTLLDELAERPSSIHGGPEFKNLRVGYDQAVKAEALRQKQFAKIVAELQADWLKTPDSEPAMKKLARADKLAQTYPEKSQVEDWRHKIQSYEDAQRSKTAKEYEGQLEELQTAYNELLAAEEKGAEDVEISAGKCLALASQLTNAKDIPEPLKVRAQTYQDAVLRTRKAVRAKVTERKAVREALKEIADAYTNPADVAKRLRSFAEAHPLHPLATEFSRAAQMEPHWRATWKWAILTAGWAANARVQDPHIIDTRLERLGEYLENEGDGPYASAAKTYRTYLAAAKGAHADGKLADRTSWRKKLAGRLYSTKLYTILTANGKRYYYFVGTAIQPFPPGDSVSYRVKHIVDNRLTEATERIKKTSIHALGEPRLAPHSAFAKKALAMLPKNDEGRGWETLYLKLAELVRVQSDIDPILKADLLKKMLRSATNVAPWCGDKIQAARNRLDDVAEDYQLRVSWMDPNSSDANEIRGQIREGLNGVRSLAGIIRDIEKRAQTLPKLLGAHEIVGIMLEQPGQMILKRTAKSADLFVILGGRDAPAFHKIGVVKNGAVVVDSAAAKACPRGSLVFARKQR